MVTLILDQNGKVFCDDINQLTWSGISLLNAEILSKIDNNNFPFDSWSSIVLPQIKEDKVTGEIYSDIWLDVGTKDRLELANKILREEIEELRERFLAPASL